MTRYFFQLGAAAALVLVAAMGLGVWVNLPEAGGPSPSPSPSANPTQSLTAEPTQPAPTPTGAPTSTLIPTPTLTPELITWSSESALADWPVPVRVELPDAGVEPVESVGNGRWWSFSDEVGDTTPDASSEVDISEIHVGLGCVAGKPNLRCIEIAMSAGLADPIPQPEDAWYGFGIVLDVDSDGVPDYRYGVDYFNTGLGPVDGSGDTMPGRVWRADLPTGDVEVVAVPQGSDNTLLGELPSADFPFAIFHLKGLDGRFYGWSSLIADGRVVATDYAPNVGWLELVNQ